MKKIVVILSVAACGFFSCIEKESLDEERRTLKDVQLTAVLAENATSHSVPVDTAKAWVQNYGKWLRSKNAELAEQVQADGKTVALPNSRSVWFSVEQLEKLLARIKAEEGDGIRFYFATYGKMQSSVDSCTKLPFDYSNLNTLLMVPTKRDGCIHRDAYGSRNSITTMDIENKGEICPPPADCGNKGATLID